MEAACDLDDEAETLPKRNARCAFLTSIIDQHGTLRVQYMGVRFDAEEMIQDIHSLLGERNPR